MEEDIDLLFKEDNKIFIILETILVGWLFIELIIWYKNKFFNKIYNKYISSCTNFDTQIERVLK